MKKIIILVLFSSLLLGGCTDNKVKETIESTDKIGYSTNSTAISKRETKQTTEVNTVGVGDSLQPNYTLQVIRTIAENTEDLDAFELSFFSSDDFPNDYKILSEPSYDGSYSFIGGLNNDESVIETGRESDLETYNLTRNPKATTLAEVKQLIEEIRQERLQKE